MRRFIQLGVPLIAFGVMGSMALAQTQSQQAPATDHSAHHDQTGQQTEQPPAMTGGMGPGMMQGGMGRGMMQGGMGALFGSRVTPTMNLSAEDVRGYLAVQSGHCGEPRGTAFLRRAPRPDRWRDRSAICKPPPITRDRLARGGSATTVLCLLNLKGGIETQFSGEPS